MPPPPPAPDGPSAPSLSMQTNALLLFVCLIRESPAANKSHNVAHIDDDNDDEDDDTLDERLLHLPGRGKRDGAERGRMRRRILKGALCSLI